MYVLQLMDTYAASWSVFLLAMLESIVIGWIYGRYLDYRTNLYFTCLFYLVLAEACGRI